MRHIRMWDLGQLGPLGLVWKRLEGPCDDEILQVCPKDKDVAALVQEDASLRPRLWSSEVTSGHGRRTWPASPGEVVSRCPPILGVWGSGATTPAVIPGFADSGALGEPQAWPPVLQEADCPFLSPHG